MRIALGDAPPTAPPPANCPAPPAGYWVNPNNCTQWLPQDQACKAGGLCLFGTGILPGRLRVGGNESNTKLYCGPLLGSTATDSIVLYGGLAALAWFALPAPAKYWAALPLAAVALFGATLGTIEV